MLKKQLLFGLANLLIAISGYAQNSWSKKLENIGTFSSPRVSDLNKDGVKDIILGAGRLEFEHSDSAIIALDGKTGELLWKNSAIDQMFGSAALQDITKDGTDDIFINGRSSELYAINGADGKVIWHFDTLAYSEGGKKRWFNFYNPQWIYDVDKDGFRDIVISNGGDIKVPAFNPNRAAGRLVILSARTGKVLADATMPDKKEIYMSVAIRPDAARPEQAKVIFGTGGETVGGHLYVGTVEMLLKGDLSKAKLLSTCEQKGFIAPPAWVDITNDGIADAVVNSVDGRIMAFDGVSFLPLWERKLPTTEAYSSMGIGYFNKDNAPDFFVSFAQGTWPDLSWTKQAMIDGVTGKIEFSDSLGYYQTSSPIAADFNGDGIDEVLLNVDYQVLDSIGFKSFYNTLLVISFETKEVITLVEGIPGHNVASTPWAGDLDNDGFLDIVYSVGTNQFKTYTFDGLRVNYIGTKIPITPKHQWGAYMGSEYDGVFKKK
jgi:outer membrane protein assembly factor BamB